MDKRIRPIGTLESTAICLGVAAFAGAAVFALLLVLADWTLLQAIFGGAVVTVVLSLILMLTLGRPHAPPVGQDGVQRPTADPARADAPGRPGQAARPLAPRNVNASSPHKSGIDASMISDTSSGPRFDGATSKPASVGLVGAPVASGGTDTTRPVGATADPVAMQQPAPLNAAVVSPEPPKAIDPVREAAPKVERTATAKAAPKKAVTAKAAPASAPTEGKKPKTLDKPGASGADDLKKIKGVGPKLEQTCNRMGFWHFEQIAAWTDAEIAWVDQNLEGFKGRVSRDDWVAQAKLLADGQDTAFSKRVDKGGVY